MMSVHITPNLEISNAFSAFAFALINLMCGFMRPKASIPKGWIWLYYLDPASEWLMLVALDAEVCDAGLACVGQFRPGVAGPEYCQLCSARCTVRSPRAAAGLGLISPASTPPSPSPPRLLAVRHGGQPAG